MPDTTHSQSTGFSQDGVFSKKPGLAARRRARACGTEGVLGADEGMGSCTESEVVLPREIGVASPIGRSGLKYKSPQEAKRLRLRRDELTKMDSSQQIVAPKKNEMCYGAPFTDKSLT